MRQVMVASWCNLNQAAEAKEAEEAERRAAEEAAEAARLAKEEEDRRRAQEERRARKRGFRGVSNVCSCCVHHRCCRGTYRVCITVQRLFGGGSAKQNPGKGKGKTKQKAPRTSTASRHSRRPRRSARPSEPTIKEDASDGQGNDDDGGASDDDAIEAAAELMARGGTLPGDDDDEDGTQVDGDRALSVDSGLTGSDVESALATHQRLQLPAIRPGSGSSSHADAQPHAQAQRHNHRRTRSSASIASGGSRGDLSTAMSQHPVVAAVEHHVVRPSAQVVRSLLGQQHPESFHAQTPEEALRQLQLQQQQEARTRAHRTSHGSSTQRGPRASSTSAGGRRDGGVGGAAGTGVSAARGLSDPRRVSASASGEVPSMPMSAGQPLHTVGQSMPGQPPASLLPGAVSGDTSGAGVKPQADLTAMLQMSYM